MIRPFQGTGLPALRRCFVEPYDTEHDATGFAPHLEVLGKVLVP